MFDKLIESNSAEAEFKPRRKFFMMSSVVVGILFLSAVVFSLYAQDINLGTDNFEIAEILAPVATDAPEPEPPRQQPQQQNEQQTSALPNRQMLIAKIDQPQEPPTTISTTRSPYLSIPDGKFTHHPGVPDSNRIGGPVGPIGTGNGTSSSIEPASTEVVKASEPPPIKAVAVKPSVIKSEGVINGKATFLPNPPYPEVARRVGAFGIVNVQVTIDETGKVISSKAISGHPMLRQTAESSAWKAKFSPTYLSRVPVKVTGVIVFNFKRG